MSILKSNNSSMLNSITMDDLQYYGYQIIWIDLHSYFEGCMAYYMRSDSSFFHLLVEVDAVSSIVKSVRVTNYTSKRLRDRGGRLDTLADLVSIIKK